MNTKSITKKIALSVLSAVFAVCLIGGIGLNYKPVTTVSAASTTPYRVTNLTQNKTFDVTFYNEVYVSKLNGTNYGGWLGDAYTVVDYSVTDNGSFFMRSGPHSASAYVVVTPNGEGKFIAGAHAGRTSVDTTVTIPEGGYLLIGRGTGKGHVAAIQAIKEGDEMSAITYSGSMFFNKTKKQGTLVSAENVISVGETTIYTKDTLVTTTGYDYKVIHTMYDRTTNDYVVTFVHEITAATSARTIVVPKGGAIFITNNSYELDGAGSAYPKTTMQQTVVGDRISYDGYIPETESIFITNTTTNVVTPISFYNDYIGDSNATAVFGSIPDGSVVAVDRNAVPNGIVSIRSGLNSNIRMVTVTNGVASGVSTPTAGADITIPEDGYLLLARGGMGQQFLTSRFTSGDSVSDITIQTVDGQAAKYVRNSTKGTLAIVSSALDVNVPNGISVYTKGSVTVGSADRYMIAKYDFAKDSFKITSRVNGSGVSVDVPDYGVILVEGANARKFNYSECLMLYSEVGDYITLDNYAPVLLNTKVSVTLNEDIVLKYHVDATACTDVSATVTFDGQQTDLIASVSGSTYIFEFDGVAPQLINEKALFVVKATYEGAEYTVEKNVSIADYCYALLEKTASELGYAAEKYAAMKTLVVDLLNYASAAQTYKEYDVTNLANKNLSNEQLELATEFVAPESKTAVSGELNSEYRWAEAGIRYSSRIDMYFVVAVANTENVSIKVNETEITDFVVSGSREGLTLIKFYYDGISLTKFDDAFTVTILNNGVAVGQVLTYSVSSNVAALDDGANVEYAALIKAAYCYGAAAKEFSAK